MRLDLEYSKLAIGQTSGDGDDYAKVILSAPGKPVVDVEVSSCDAYTPFNIKLQCLFYSAASQKNHVSLVDRCIVFEYICGIQLSDVVYQHATFGKIY